jgi:RecA/RadA recombinase
MSSLVQIPSVLPGLHHFDDSNLELFFGRKRQVDDLLSIIQEGRFIGIVGPEGAGKTSLIKAGLVPALKNGFTGAAGRDWSFCYCRPGITPIENLASALSEKYVLGDQEKGSLEMDDEIVKLMRKDHSGILNAVSKYSISGDGNLLIIIDQFEDIFDLAEKGKVGLAWEQEIALFLNNIAKAIASKNTSIYVLISMQSDFIPLLYNFRVLHEHISKGLYSVPNFRQDDFHHIISGSLLHLGYKITDDALNYIEEGFNQDLRNLPMVQLLLKKIQLTYPHEDAEVLTELTLSNIKKFGELEGIVEKDLDQYFNQLPIFDQQVLELLFRNITQPGEGLKMKKPRTLKEINDVIGVEKNELVRVITDLKNKEEAILDVIEPYQKNVSHFKEAYISDSAVINLSNNHLIKNWPNLIRWIAEEKESTDTYIRLSESAKLFQQGQTGYLRPPDLDLVMAWFDKVQPKKIWADQFNQHYRMSIDYLLESNETYIEELEQKEEERKEELRKARKRQLFLIVVVGIVSLFCAFAFFQKYKANQATEAAKISADNAEIAKKTADNAAKLAEIERKNAIANERSARLEKIKADSATIQALRAEQEAKRSEEIAKSEKSRAEVQAENARKSMEIANRETDKATVAQKEAEESQRKEKLLKQLESAKARILALNNRLSYEKFDSEKDKLDFAKEVVAAYQKLDTLSRETEDGKILPNNSLYNLLTQVEYKILENTSQLASKYFVVDKSKIGAGLRSIDIINNNKIIAGGDENVLINYSVSTGNIQPIIPQLNKKRIRKVRFVDENKVVFTNVTGGIYLMDLSNSTEQKVKEDGQNVEFPINDLIVSNEKIYTVFNGSLVQYGTKNFETGNIPLKSVENIYELNSEKIFVQTSQGLFLLDTKSMAITPIVLAPEKETGGTPKISAVVASENKVFIGTDDGKIWIYDNPKGTFSTLKNPWIIFAHKSRVTALEYDIKTNQLFTASLDKTAKIFDFSIENRDKIRAQVVKIEGFDKWIWDFVLVSPKNSNTKLYTVDEKGMLMRWDTEADALFKKIDAWVKQKK